MQRRLSSRSGQATIEAVLLLTVFVIAATLIANFSKSNGMLKAFVSGPWSHLQGMIESGVWDTPANARDRHPNSRSRQSTVRGDGREQ